MAKRFSHQMSKTFHICKWISLAILTFVIVEEMPSEDYRIFEIALLKLKFRVWELGYD